MVSVWLFALAPSATAAKIGPAVALGTITSQSLQEVSGIVDSRANSNAFWVHNDSGDGAIFYSISHQGALLGTFTLAGVGATDWEDAAVGANPSGGNFLYFADIGDNDTNRSSISVFRVGEPTTTGTATILAAGYTRTRLRYPNGARNAEALIVDPWTSDLFILTKAGTTQLYSAPASAFGSTEPVTLTSLGNVASAVSTVTAADISPDGRYLLVRSKSVGRLYERGVGQSILQALQGPGIAFTLGAESQGEAIAWSAGGDGFYTTSEFDGGSSAPIHRYWFADMGLGDFDNDGDMDGADLSVWAAASSGGTTADSDADGDSDGADFLTWQRHFTGPRTGTLSAVAEPACGWLVVSGLGVVLLLRRNTVLADTIRGNSSMRFSGNLLQGKFLECITAAV